MSYITDASHKAAKRREANAEDVSNYYQLKRQVAAQHKLIAALQKQLKAAQELIDDYGRRAAL